MRFKSIASMATVMSSTPFATKKRKHAPSETLDLSIVQDATETKKKKKKKGDGTSGHAGDDPEKLSSGDKGKMKKHLSDKDVKHSPLKKPKLSANSGYFSQDSMLSDVTKSPVISKTSDSKKIKSSPKDDKNSFVKIKERKPSSSDDFVSSPSVTKDKSKKRKKIYKTETEPITESIKKENGSSESSAKSNEGSDSCFNSPDIENTSSDVSASAVKKTPKKTPDKPSPVMSLTKLEHLCDVEGWSQEDLKNLLDAIKKQIPTADHKSYMSRMKKIKWDEISVANFTSQQCMKKFMSLHSKVRRLRTLQEIIEDLEHLDKVLHPERSEPPKKPLTVYFKFQADYVEKIKKQGKRLLPGDVAKAYSELSEKKKKKYEDKYQEDMVKFREDMKKFREDNPGVVKLKGKHAHHKHGHGTHTEKPPTQITAHQLYINHEVEKALSHDSKCDKKKVSEDSRKEWYELKDKKKLKWINKALELDKEYHEKMADYCSIHPDFSAKPPRPVITKAEQKIKDKAEGIPVKPSTAFALFCAENLMKLRHLPGNHRMAENAKCWKNLTDEERKKYSDKASKEMQKYNVYLKSLVEDDRQKLLTEPKSSRRTRIKKMIERHNTTSEDRNQSKITEFYSKDQDVKSDHSGSAESDSEGEMSDVIPPTETMKTSSKLAAQKINKQHTASSSESESEDEASKKRVPRSSKVTPQNQLAAQKTKKKQSASSSSSSSSSESEDESPRKPVPRSLVTAAVTPQDQIAAKTPSPTKLSSPAVRGKPAVSKSPAVPTQSRPLPVKTPLPSRKKPADSVSSSSSTSGSSSDSDSGSESDDENEEAVQLTQKPQSPNKVQKSPFTAAISQEEESSESESDSGSGSDSSSSVDVSPAKKPTQDKAVDKKVSTLTKTPPSKNIKESPKKRAPSPTKVSTPMKTKLPATSNKKQSPAKKVKEALNKSASDTSSSDSDSSDSE